MKAVKFTNRLFLISLVDICDKYRDARFLLFDIGRPNKEATLILMHRYTNVEALK